MGVCRVMVGGRFKSVPFGPTIAHEPLYLGIFVGGIISLFVLLAGFSQGIFDFHDFRQAQTALTTYWMTKGGDLLAYETPVAGYPWTIPFELPVYQWASALASLSGLSIFEASRLVSWAFFIGFLVFAAGTLKRLDISNSVILTFVILTLCSPLYLFWSRTVMIESTAIMFGAMFLYGLVGYLKKPNFLDAILLFAGLALCCLVKVTTLVSFAALAAIMTLWFLYKDYQAGASLVALGKRAFVPAFAAITAFVLLLVWLDFADTLKAKNPFGETLTSSGLSLFNLGTLAQRLNPAAWIDVFFGRAVRDTIGSPVLVILIGWVIYKTRFMVWPAIISMFLYVLPFLIFTNLHLVHNYYQYANAFFLLLFFSIGVVAAGKLDLEVFATWSERRKQNTFLSVLVVMQLWVFSAGYWQFVIKDQSQDPAYQIGAYFNKAVQPNEVAFSFGNTWSSIHSLMSERRVITLPDGAAPIALATKDMKVWTGGARIAAVVDCETNNAASMKPFIVRLTVGMKPMSIGKCLVYTPS
jgi:hypothetical protein